MHLEPYKRFTKSKIYVDISYGIAFLFLDKADFFHSKHPAVIAECGLTRVQLPLCLQ